MTRRHSNLLYVGLALILAAIAVQRFRAFAGRLRRPAHQAHSHRGPVIRPSEFVGQIGAGSQKLKRQNGKTLLWASGRPISGDAAWFDVSDAPMEPTEFQFGIGKDMIPAINEPKFVVPDDPRLAENRIKDDSRVIGYASAGEAKAYPISILNRHELVNDRIGGKPITVGW